MADKNVAQPSAGMVINPAYDKQRKRLALDAVAEIDALTGLLLRDISREGDLLPEIMRGLLARMKAMNRVVLVVLGEDDAVLNLELHEAVWGDIDQDDLEPQLVKLEEGAIHG